MPAIPLGVKEEMVKPLVLKMTSAFVSCSCCSLGIKQTKLFSLHSCRLHTCGWKRNCNVQRVVCVLAWSTKLVDWYWNSNSYWVTKHLALSQSVVEESVSDSAPAEESAGLPPPPSGLEKYLLGVAFVLGILLTVGVLYLTFVEWKDRRLRKESEEYFAKGEDSKKEPHLNRFARRLKKKEEKLRARRKM
eukprot:jgi/Galph1/2666/GphlegSOOS_G1371.1